MLFNYLRSCAVSCKTPVIGLKIRRPLPVVGVRFPLRAPEFNTVHLIEIEKLILRFTALCA